VLIIGPNFGESRAGGSRKYLFIENPGLLVGGFAMEWAERGFVSIAGEGTGMHIDARENMTPGSSRRDFLTGLTGFFRINRAFSCCPPVWIGGSA
jgi:hypothetical protein